MQRSSESIAKLAAALAKAQGELVNPEKSLTATVKTDGGAAQQSFRYAPLSSGLEIVRKTLGQHEIAVVQSTSTDSATGMINLTTMLAHASGEWIASEWPVCALSETSAPHRLGAALTYARRYALFTLVGIAGEDDMDAPDPAGRDPRNRPPERASGNGASGRMETIIAPCGRHRGVPARRCKARPRAGSTARHPWRWVTDSLLRSMVLIESKEPPNGPNVAWSKRTASCRLMRAGLNAPSRRH
jgi:ERF superfamily